MKEEKDEKKKKPLINRFSQFIVFWCLLYGLLLTTVSYVWSWFGKEPLVDLSTTIVTTIVGPVCLWLVQNMFCNVFENNKLSFSTPISLCENTESNNNDEKEITNEQDT